MSLKALKNAAPSAPRRPSPWRPAARSLHHWMQPTIARMLKRRGFADARLLLAWRDIMGAELADICVPWRVRQHKDGAVLQIRVRGLFALHLQHIAPEILARIHRLYGYRAFARLQFFGAQGERAPRHESQKRMTR